jgi:hypothetical protein
MSGTRTVKNKTYKHYHTFGNWTINMELIASWVTKPNGDITVYLESNIPVDISAGPDVDSFKEWVAAHVLEEGYRDENLQ